jgi:hypothetical protein
LSTFTPNLNLDELDAAQSQPEVKVNAALRKLDTLVQMSVLSIANAPPGGTPADGDRHIVGTSPTGAYAAHENTIAYWVAGTFNEWRFQTSKAGWLAYVEALDKYYYFPAGSPAAWTVTAII